MSWIIPSTIAALSTTAVLTFVYAYLYAQERHHHLKLWAWSWAIYTVRFVFELLYADSPDTNLWMIGAQVASVASALLLFSGTLRFLNRRIRPYWFVAGALSFLWIIAASVMQMSLTLISLPTFLMVGALYILTGWTLLGQGDRSIGAQITSWTLILWGIHKLDFPFLRPITWFAPWGFLLGAVFSLIVAVGTLILYFQQIKAALALNEQRFRRLAENAQDLIYRYRLYPDPVFEYVSPSATAMTGYTPEDHYADPLLGIKLVHPDDLHLVSDLAMSDEASLRKPRILRWIHKNGALLWTEQRNVPIYDETGRLIALEGIARDLTERIEAELQIQQQAAREEAINQIISAASEADNLQKFLETSLEQALQALGLTIGSCWIGESVVHCGMEQTVLEELHSFVLGHNVEVTDPIIVNDWQSVTIPQPIIRDWFLHNHLRSALIVPILYIDAPLGGIGVANSVPRAWTEHEIALLKTVGHQLGTVAARLRLVEQLSEATQRLQQVIDSVPEGVCLLDAQYRVVLTNAGADAMLSLLANVQVGDILQQLGEHPIAELLEPPPQALWHEIEVGQRVFTLRGQHLSEQVIHEGWLIVLSDVTHEREIQQKVQEQDRLAAVGQLAAGIAHDFNNIMGVILLYSQMAARTPDIPDKMRHQLTSVVDQARQAGDLIQQILDFSRHSTIESTRMDLVPFLKEIIKLLRRTLPENVDIALNCAHSQLYTQADATRLQQVVMNLAVNARDAMPNGGKLSFHLDQIEIESVSAERRIPLAAGNWIELRIDDSGTGIHPSVIPHIFEPFFTTKDKGKGTGLGLAQVYGIVKQHGGEVHVESVAGRGTSFIVYLPAWTQLSTGETVVGDHMLLAGHGECILVVEDNDASLVALAESLEIFLNYRTLSAANGEEALACWHAHQGEIDLVLSDVVMPRLGGVLLLQHLRRLGASVPVVLMTGHASSESVQQALSEENTRLITKPINLEHLSETLAQALAG